MRFRQFLIILTIAGLIPTAAADTLISGFAGDEFRVNSQTYGDQRVPLLAMRPDGEVLFVWQSPGPPGASWDVLARRMDAGGSLLAPESQVNDYAGGRQDGQHVARLSGGGFAVAWSGESRGGAEQAIQARLLDAQGRPIGSDLEVGGQFGELHFLPRVAGAADGGFVVAWEGRGIFDDTMSIHAQRFSASGLQVGPLLRISQRENTQQRRVDLARNSAGRTLFVWQSSGPDGDGWGVFGRCLDDGGGDSGDFRINQSIEGAQSQPRVAALGDDGFAVVWHDNRGQSSFEYRRVMLRHFDAQCLPVNDERQVNQFDEGIQDLPAVAASEGGSHVVVWQSLPEEFEDQGIYARRIDGELNFYGQELRISVEEEAYQDFPDLGMRPGGGFVAVWESAGQDGSGFGILARRFEGPTAAIVEVVSGDQQSGEPGQAFADRLVVRVRDQWGVARPDQPVRFASESADPGVVFANGSSTQTVRTDQQGLASVEAIASNRLGAFEVSASLPGAIPAAVFRLRVVGSAAPVAVPVAGGPGWLLLAAAMLLAGLAAGSGLSCSGAAPVRRCGASRRRGRAHD